MPEHCPNDNCEGKEVVGTGCCVCEYTGWVWASCITCMGTGKKIKHATIRDKL